MNVQIPGWKWFPLLKGETPARGAGAKRPRRAAVGAWRAEGATQPVIDA